MRYETLGVGQLTVDNLFLKGGISGSIFGQTGKVWYVDSNYGVNGPGRGHKPDIPFATIDYAIGKCRTDRNDVIMALPQHAETVTEAITGDVAGISIFGISNNGRNLPVITPNGAIDAMTLTAAGITVGNLEFAIPGTTNQTADINVAAAKCAILNTIHHCSTTAKIKVNCITLPAGAHDTLISGARIYNDTVEMTGGGIAIEGVSKRVEICHSLIIDSVGLALGAIYDGATALQLYIHHNVLKNAKAATVVLEFGNNSTGICSFNHISGRHTTIASNVAAGTGMDFFENRVTEEAALNGMIMPASDSD
jgi:hypothetical protein